jgi:photosystem II CP43 chlorophyll apoprotein
MLLSWSMTLFKLPHNDASQSMCQQGLTLFPLLVILYFGVEPSEEIIDIYSYLVLSTIDRVRVISEPTLKNLVTIFSCLVGLTCGVWTPVGMASVNTLQNIMREH